MHLAARASEGRAVRPPPLAFRLRAPMNFVPVGVQTRRLLQLLCTPNKAHGARYDDVQEYRSLGAGRCFAVRKSRLHMGPQSVGGDPRRSLLMRYDPYYWASIPGRGELVRRALEDAGARYVDVARSARGEARMLKLLGSDSLATPPFAPAFLKAGNRLIGQTANILLFLGDHHDLAPKPEAGRLWTHQLQLTLADLVVEAHDTH